MHLTSLCGQGATMIQPLWAGNAFTFSTETVDTTVTGDADEPAAGHTKGLCCKPMLPTPLPASLPPGFFIANGLAASGGAILIQGSASPYISYCSFQFNVVGCCDNN